MHYLFKKVAKNQVQKELKVKPSNWTGPEDLEAKGISQIIWLFLKQTYSHKACS